MTWPMTKSPIADGESAPMPRWYQRFLKPINDTYAALVADDTGWIAASLANSWVSTGAPYAAASYRRRRGVVRLRGLVQAGTLGNPITTLPAGFCPLNRLIFAVASFATSTTTGMARIDVKPTGEVLVNNYAFGGTNTWVSLHGVWFYADN